MSDSNSVAPLSKNPQFSARRASMFIRFLAETGRVAYAAQCAGFADVNQLYKKRRADDDFAEQWNEALEIAGDRFEAEAVRRAVDGVEEPITYKGEVTGYKTVYSDGLLAKLMDGAKPGKYRHNVTEVKGEINHRGAIAVLPMQAKNVEEWERECAKLHPIGVPLLEGDIVEVEPNARIPVLTRA